MAVTMATLSAILKEVYEGNLRSALNNDVKALKRIERTSNGVSSNIGGKKVTFPIHYGRNAGIGSRDEMEDLPAAGSQATAAAELPLKHHYGTIALSGQTFELADTNAQAFTSALDLETTGLKNDLLKDMNRQVYSDGNGTLGTFTTPGSAPPTWTSTGNNVVVATGFYNLGINTIFDIYEGSTLKLSKCVVTGVNRTTGTITFSVPSGSLTTVISTKYYFVRAGSYGKQWTGLGAIVSDSGTLYGVDPADVDQWRSYVDDNSGTPRVLSEEMIIEAVDATSANGGKTSVLLTSKGVRRAYFSLLKQNREFVNTTQENKKFEGGFTGLGFTTDEGEIPLVSDNDCPEGNMFGLDESHLKVYRDHDWKFMNRTGSNWIQIPGSVAGTMKDGYQATMFQYSELGIDSRGAHFVIKDLKNTLS